MSEATAEPPLHSLGETPCERCGTFGTLVASWDRQLCAACVARRHPAESAPFTLGSLLEWSLKLCVELAPQLLPSMLVATALDAVSDAATAAAFNGSVLLLSTAPIALDAASTDLMAAYTAIVVLRYLEHGERLDARAAWLRVGALLPTFVLVNLVVGVLGVLGMMLCIFPGLAVMAAVLLAVPIAAREPLGPLASVRASAARIKPVFWTAFCAAALLVLPVMLFSIAGGFLADVNGRFHAPLLAQVMQGAGFLCWLPALVLAPIAYAKLRGAATVTL
jgi:hypothetical protein